MPQRLVSGLRRKIARIMPDWFYRTVSQPLLFRLTPHASRDLALGVIGTVGRTPGGKYIIDVLGHMIPDARLRRSIAGIEVGSPVGFGIGMDTQLRATAAFRRFGVGLIEVGPVAVTGLPEPEMTRDITQQTIGWRGPCSIELNDALVRLPRKHDPRTALLARIAPVDTQDAVALCEALAPRVRGFSFELRDTPNDTHRAVVDTARRLGSPVFVVLPAEDPAIVEHAHQALAIGAAGIIVDGSFSIDTAEPQRVFGPASFETVRRATLALRAALGPDTPVIANGGVHQPEDALAMLNAGASLVQIDSGLVFSGPGLVKRIDDAVMHHMLVSTESPAGNLEQEPKREWLSRSWFWLLLLGLAMTFGAVLATWIAMTHVLLPYDEVFVGLSFEQINSLNPRLIDFLTHDRMTLAGLTLSAGIVYTGLALNGVRSGWHWAEGTVLVSAVLGTLTFFLFLGFGYFEPFHGWVTAILTQFMLAGARSSLDPVRSVPRPAMREDPDWRMSLWGQLCWILFGVGLLVAGAVICWVGVTHVFVPEDLAFMGITPAQIEAASPRLLPMIAHDRATVGGLLLSGGLN
jgi:dihydroorotate dehydrogenase